MSAVWAHIGSMCLMSMAHVTPIPIKIFLPIMIDRSRNPFKAFWQASYHNQVVWTPLGKMCKGVKVSIHLPKATICLIFCTWSFLCTGSQRRSHMRLGDQPTKLYTSLVRFTTLTSTLSNQVLSLNFAVGYFGLSCSTQLPLCRYPSN